MTVSPVLDHDFNRSLLLCPRLLATTSLLTHVRERRYFVLYRSSLRRTGASQCLHCILNLLQLRTGDSSSSLSIIRSLALRTSARRVTTRPSPFHSARALVSLVQIRGSFCSAHADSFVFAIISFPFLPTDDKFSRYSLTLRTCVKPHYRCNLN